MPCSLAVQNVNILNGNVETNDGLPRQNQNKSFSICHWNFTSITANDYGKMSLQKAFNRAYKMSIICLTKTDLVSSTQLDDDNLELPDYNLFCSEYRSSNKQEENFLYYEIQHVFCRTVFVLK